MSDARVVIIDYGVGNIFSILRACEAVGMRAQITSEAGELADASGIILPGVGAFGDAMEALKNLDLVSPLREAVGRNTPVLGICLGMQLLMSESTEFGRHEGLDFLKGKVVRFDAPKRADGLPLKVPQVGWNRISPPAGSGAEAWEGTLYAGLPSDFYAYFVHSFYVVPDDETVVLSKSTYGGIEFCSSLRKGNLYGMQFHPERSSFQGLHIYRNFADLVRSHAAAAAGKTL